MQKRFTVEQHNFIQKQSCSYHPLSFVGVLTPSHSPYAQVYQQLKHHMCGVCPYAHISTRVDPVPFVHNIYNGLFVTKAALWGLSLGIIFMSNLM